MSYLTKLFINLDTITVFYCTLILYSCFSVCCSNLPVCVKNGSIGMRTNGYQVLISVFFEKLPFS